MTQPATVSIYTFSLYNPIKNNPSETMTRLAIFGRGNLNCDIKQREVEKESSFVVERHLARRLGT
jgi:hypothetical protein